MSKQNKQGYLQYLPCNHFYLNYFEFAFQISCKRRAGTSTKSTNKSNANLHGFGFWSLLAAFEYNQLFERFGLISNLLLAILPFHIFCLSCDGYEVEGAIKEVSFVQGVPSIGTHFRFQFLTFLMVLNIKKI